MVHGKFSGLTKVGVALSVMTLLSACMGGDTAPNIDRTPNQTPEREAVNAQPVMPSPEYVGTTPAPVQAVKPLLTLEDMIGTDPKKVFEMMGKPRLIRREDPMYLMQYQNKECILDVIFYDQNGDHDYKVTTLSARNGHGDKLDSLTCLRSHSK